MSLNINLQKAFCWHRILFYTCTITCLTKCLFGGIYIIVFCKCCHEYPSKFFLYFYYFFNNLLKVRLQMNILSPKFIPETLKEFEVTYNSTCLCDSIQASSPLLPCTCTTYLSSLDNTESLRVLSIFTKLIEWHTILICIFIKRGTFFLIFNRYLFFFLWELLMCINSLCIVKSLISQRPPGTNLKSDKIRCINLMQQRRALQRSSEMPHDKREQGSIF